MKKKPLHTTVVKVFATSKGSARPPDALIGEIRLDYHRDGEVATLVSGTPKTMDRVLDAAKEATGSKKVVGKPGSGVRGRFGEYVVAVLSGTMFGALWRWGSDRDHDDPPPDDATGEELQDGDGVDDQDFEYQDIGQDYFDGGAGL